MVLVGYEVFIAHVEDIADAGDDSGQGPHDPCEYDERGYFSKFLDFFFMNPLVLVIDIDEGSGDQDES